MFTRQQIFLKPGASKGNQTLMLAKFFPQAHIFAFEPVEESFAVLKQKTASQPNISIFNYALGDFSGKTQMFLSHIPNKPTIDGRSSSSLLPPYQHEQYSASGKVFDEIKTVEVKTLDDYAAQNNIKAIDFIRMT